MTCDPDRGRKRREELWRSLGAGAGEMDELLAYCTDAFDYDALPARYPLPDEPFVGAWQSYVDCSRDMSLLACLRDQLVQLRFPVQSGISATDLYRSVTRRGQRIELLSGPGLIIENPGGLVLRIHQTLAGRIPVLLATTRGDFVSLVQALTRQNEPWPVPDSMGACLVVGYNNWGRIFELQKRWRSLPPADRSPAEWPARFREIAQQPSLYRDRFVLLSAGPYSATPAADLGLTEETWERRSLAIRLEHECTHLFTRHVLGSMRNALIDELIADYMGIVASHGTYRADWLLHFFGLERFPLYRRGARLENYLGAPPLSARAFSVLCSAAARAAHNLQEIDRVRRDQASRSAPDDGAAKASVIIALTRIGLEGLAAPDAPDLFRSALAALGGPATATIVPPPASVGGAGESP
jgi:hypothetical protein